MPRRVATAASEIELFPLRFLLKAFLATSLVRSPHELAPAFAFFPHQDLPLRSDDFFDWSRIGVKRLIDGHGKPETNSGTNWIARCVQLALGPVVAVLFTPSTRRHGR